MITVSAPDAGVLKGTAILKAKSGKHRKMFTYGAGQVAAHGAGTMTLAIKITRKSGKELRKLGRATVWATITFTPTGGTPAHDTIKLVVKASRKGHFS